MVTSLHNQAATSGWTDPTQLSFGRFVTRTGRSIIVLAGVVIVTGCAGFWSGPVLQAAVFQQLQAGIKDDEPQSNLDPELQRQIRLLQRQLNADDLAQREQAEREILAMGSKILDYLPPESESQAVELRERLTRIRLTLELQAAAEVAKPIPITLQGTLSAPELLEKIRQQTNNVTVASLLENQQFTVAWENVNYWEAIDEIADSLKLRVSADQGSGVVLRPNENATGRRERASYHGAFRASPLRLQRTRDLTATVPPLVNFTMMLEWEPKLRVIRLELPLEGVTIQSHNDASKSMTVGGSGQKIGFGVAGEHKSSTVSLSLPDLDAIDPESVDILGKFDLLVAGREETFRFKELKSALESKQQIEKSGIKVQLEDVAYDDHLMLVKIGIQFSDAKQSLESHLGWIYQNTVEVVDKNGQSHSYLTIESGGRRDQGLALVYLFDRFEDLEGYSLVYRSPGILIDLEVPFRLNDIPVR